MNAEILCVGTELLLGDIVNTNAAYIARGLAECGIACYYQTVVGDNPERLKNALRTAFERADIVITTGGLGPTYDDLTKETVAGYFDLQMKMHEESLQHLKEVFAKFGRTMTQNNEKQAVMPEGATVFFNDRGTAPGLAVADPQSGKTAIMLPGPPREMTAMFDWHVKPYLTKLSGACLVSHTIHLFGIGESMVEDRLHDYMQAHSNPTVAPYAKEGEVQLRITAGAENKEQADQLTLPVLSEISALFPEYIYGIDTLSLQNTLVSELIKKKQTIATAESCTGGLVSKRITEISGASAVFGCGICSYSNECKIKLLGVSEATLAQYGAVSKQTAIEMARGIRKLSNADIGLSVTGIAGPDGGTKEKPVGLVYVSVSSNKLEKTLELHLSRGYGEERELIRYMASSHALHLALSAARS